MKTCKCNNPIAYIGEGYLPDLCEDCAEKEDLVYNEGINRYVRSEDWKEYYLDDEISDLDTWVKAND